MKDAATADVATLSEHPNIAAIKDCGGDPGKALALITQARLQVLAGEDLQMFSTIAQGGSGAIAASAHLATRQFVEMIALLRGGELKAARSLWQCLVPWVESVFAEPNPAPIKGMLARLGAIDGEVRAPLTPASTDHLASMALLHNTLLAANQPGGKRVSRQ